MPPARGQRSQSEEKARVREQKVSSTFSKVAGCGAEPHDLELRRRRGQRCEVVLCLQISVWNGVRLRRRRLAEGKSDAEGKSNPARSTKGRPADCLLPSALEIDPFWSSFTRTLKRPERKTAFASVICLRPVGIERRPSERRRGVFAAAEGLRSKASSPCGARGRASVLRAVHFEGGPFCLG